MRILVVAPEPFYEDRGTPIAVRQVLEALVECGYAVDLLTYPVGAEIELPGVRVLRCPRPLPIRSVPIGFSLRKVILDLSLVWALRRRLGTDSYQAVHAVEEMAFPAVWLARRRGIPVVYDMQSSLPEGLAEVAAFRIPPLPRVFRWLEGWLLRNASYVVSSTGLAVRVGTLAPRTPHREWKFPGAAAAAGASDAAQLREELDIPAEAPVVLYTGNFAEYQGVPLLLAAMRIVGRAHPEAVLVLVGSADGDALAAGAARDEAVRVVERRPREEMPAFYRMADVLVSPRVGGSNLPLKVLDYMAARRAIVATDIAAHRAVLDESRALLVPPESEGLAIGIDRALSDSELASSLGDAAAVYAEEHLGWSTFVTAIESVYEEVQRASGAGEEASSAVGAAAAGGRTALGPLTRVPLATLALWDAALVYGRLRRSPLPAVVAWLDRPPFLRIRPVEPLRLGRFVYRVLGLAPRRPRCLVISLIFFRMLRRQEMAPELVIGLPLDPTTHEAHAWVEVEGRVVGPPPGTLGHRPLARYGGSSTATTAPNARAAS